jgi:hypothetical protein
VLRVRVIADDATRIAAAMRDKGLDERQAAEFVKRLDGQLAKWTRLLYGVDWQDPMLYDAVLNLEEMGVDGAVAVIVGMTRLERFQPTPQSRKSFDDLLLASRVWSALTVDARTRSANIRVGADGGAVHITGAADGGRMVAAITEIAERVDGVAEVRNEVGVGSDWQW